MEAPSVGGRLTPDPRGRRLGRSVDDTVVAGPARIGAGTYPLARIRAYPDTDDAPGWSHPGLIPAGSGVVPKGPPAYAWDWFARQRLLWREVRSRLAASSTPAASRYAAVETRSEVVPLLRADYAHQDTVRAAVDAVVRELVFLGHTDRPFAELGVRNAPRGMRWWWTALSGEQIDAPAPGRDRMRRATEDADQLTLDEVLRGYGD